MDSGRVGRAIALGGLLLLLGAALGAGAAVVRDAAAYAGRIYPGISIGGIPVGGLTPGEAMSALRPVVDRALGAPLHVVVADRTVTFTYEEVGRTARPDDAIRTAYSVGRSGRLWERVRTRVLLAREPVALSLPFGRDPKRLRTVLRGLAAELDTVARDAQVTVRDGAVVLLAPGRPGQTLDVDGTAARIGKAVEMGAPEAEAVLRVVQPEFTTAEAGELAALLASYTTKMAANPNRTHNIALASGAIRGLILPPGEVFSYNKTVGPRTIERGFREAPVLVDDELVPGDGGGICQVSSTLFNVALLADFAILTRTNHSRPVAYLPAGRDATVVYGALDLLFRNTTAHHVLLWTEIRGNRLTISAFGTPAERTEVAVVVEDRQEIPPPKDTVAKEDPELEAGKIVAREAQPGLRVKTYRVVKVDGVVVRREYIGTSYYRPVRRTIKVGTKRVDASEPHP